MSEQQLNKNNLIHNNFIIDRDGYSNKAIEILTSKNIELKVDNLIKQLAQHLDAQYKNTQDDNICIFKSIQSMK